MLNGYINADFAKDQKTRRSTDRFIFKFRGKIISWFLKKQKLVTTSIIESEYIAMKKAGQQVI